jgi:hypothetical protein
MEWLWIVREGVVVWLFGGRRMWRYIPGHGVNTTSMLKLPIAGKLGGSVASTESHVQNCEVKRGKLCGI